MLDISVRPHAHLDIKFTNVSVLCEVQSEQRGVESASQSVCSIPSVNSDKLMHDDIWNVIIQPFTHVFKCLASEAVYLKSSLMRFDQGGSYL